MAETGGRTVPVWLGLGSRYSYLAATQLDALAARTGVAFDWHPVNSVRLIRDANDGASPFDAPVPRGQYAMAWRDTDARRWADLYGVPYVTPDLRGADLDTMAASCWAAGDAAARAALVRAFHAAIFAEGRRMDIAAIAGIAAAHGVDPGDQEGRARHDAARARALRAGVFGVPTVEIGGALFWGNDRLVLVERHLMTEARNR